MKNVAVFGAGRIGRIHASNLAALPGVRLQYVCDAVPSAAAELAQERGVRLIAITDSRMSPLAKDAEVTLIVQDNSTFGFRALTSTMGLAQSLFIALAYALELPYRPTSPNVSS